MEKLEYKLTIGIKYKIVITRRLKNHCKLQSM